MKDFIFFNYDWVPNSTYIFRSFEAAGYSCDFVNEQNLMDVRFTKEKYRCVVVYLHEPWQLPHINSLISRYWPDAFLIQHDDTDEEQNPLKGKQLIVPDRVIRAGEEIPSVSRYR